jgi:murein DD-endopeptidase MepM/ murein hydrolase activator NlpD
VQAVRAGDRFKATLFDRPLETRVVGVGGTLEGSLWQAFLRSGEQTHLVTLFADAFAWDIDFFVDPQPGDTFRLLVEKKFVGDKFFGYGRVLAAEYASPRGARRAFLWQAKAGSADAYYDDQGKPLARPFLRTPLRLVRVSSRFDRNRFHPFAHLDKGHPTVDYGAPQGTPVSASAGGRVLLIGAQGMGGNTVVLEHPSGMQTRYEHLLRYAHGLQKGQLVRQKQVIGYVGKSGLASATHLQFSVIEHGAYVDPLVLLPPAGAPLAPPQLAAFSAQLATWKAELSRIATPTFVQNGGAAEPTDTVP